MGRIFLCAPEAGRAAAEQAALRLAAAGWRVETAPPPRLLDPGDVALAVLIGGAGPEVLPAGGAVVTAALDAASAGAPGAFDLSGWTGATDDPSFTALERALRAAAAPGARAAPAVEVLPVEAITVEASAPRIIGEQRPGLMKALAVAALALALAATVATVLWRTGRLGPIEEAAAPSAPAAPAGAADFAALDRRDPQALRAFLAGSPAGAAAAEARAALGALEAAAWTAASTTADLPARMRALDAYAVDFPDAGRMDTARAMRAAASDTLQRAEAALSALGFSPGPVDGAPTAETAAAVAAYRASLGRAGPAVLDEALAAHMQAAAEAAAPDAFAAATPGPEAVAIARGAIFEALAPPSAAATATAVVTPAPPEVFRDCYVCPEMTALPLGKAQIGDLTGAGDVDERPVREVTIAYGLAVGRYEVTFEEYDACVADGDCARRPADPGPGQGRLPVTDVTWREAKQYAAWLSRRSGKRYRLLSEAEWEYAARAGTRTPYPHGDDPAGLCAIANHADAEAEYPWRNRACADGRPAGPAPVGSYAANAFGLFDMHGNVWEWVEDCWRDSYAGAPTNGAAWIQDCPRPERVLRGGAWSVKAANVRSSYRLAFDPAARTPYFGFRVAREMR